MRFVARVAFGATAGLMRAALLWLLVLVRLIRFLDRVDRCIQLHRLVLLHFFLLLGVGALADPGAKA